LRHLSIHDVNELKQLMSKSLVWLGTSVLHDAVDVWHKRLSSGMYSCQEGHFEYLI